MTWPIVEGVSLLFLHISRGKRSVVLDLRTDAGRDAFLELVRDADAVVEAMRPGGLDRRGLGFEASAQGQPADRVLTISGYGATGPTATCRATASPTTCGRDRRARDRRRRLRVHARARVDRHQRRPGVRRARPARRRVARRARRAKVASSRSRSPMRPPPSTGSAARRSKAYERPESEVTGNAADNYERRAPGTGGMEAGVRYQFYATTDGYVLFMASEREFWKNFCEGVGRPDLFERWPGSQYGDHAHGNTELRAILRDVFATRVIGGVAGVRDGAQHADRAVEHAQDDLRRPAVPATACRGCPRATSGPRCCRHADQVRRRDTARCRPWRPPSVEHTEQVLRDVLGWDDARIAAAPGRGCLRRQVADHSHTNCRRPRARRYANPARMAGATRRARRAGESRWVPTSPAGTAAPAADRRAAAFERSHNRSIPSALVNNVWSPLIAS